MTNAFQTTSSPILLIGLLIAAAVAVRAFLDRTYVPALVGFIGLGILLGLADDRFDILSEEGHAALDILAELGIVALLFRVGLESDIAGLRRQLGRASLVWMGNVLLTAVPGYFVMSWLLGYDQIPSLIAAVALTATSIGVSVGMWQQHDALGTPKGQLLTDVAEMDDLSGLALMVLLFAVVPILHETGAGAERERRRDRPERIGPRALGGTAVHGRHSSGKVPRLRCPLRRLCTPCRKADHPRLRTVCHAPRDDHFRCRNRDHHRGRIGLARLLGRGSARSSPDLPSAGIPTP